MVLPVVPVLPSPRKATAGTSAAARSRHSLDPAPEVPVTLDSSPALTAHDSDDGLGDPPDWMGQVDRLVIEIAAYARGRKAQLAGVTLRVPPGVNGERVRRALHGQLRARGHAAPRVDLVRQPGRFLLVSVEFARAKEATAPPSEAP